MGEKMVRASACVCQCVCVWGGGTRGREGQPSGAHAHNDDMSPIVQVRCTETLAPRHSLFDEGKHRPAHAERCVDDPSRLVEGAGQWAIRAVPEPRAPAEWGWPQRSTSTVHGTISLLREGANTSRGALLKAELVLAVH